VVAEATKAALRFDEFAIFAAAAGAADIHARSPLAEAWTRRRDHRLRHGDD